VIAAVLLLLAGAGAAVAVATGVFKGSTNTVVRHVPPSNPTTPTTPTGPLVSTSAVQDILREYASDYSNEDAGGLSSLLTPDVKRTAGADNTTDRASAISIYQNQFSQLSNPRYTLRNVTITPGHGEATAQGTYEITADGKTPATGAIRFHMTENGGQLLIDAIDISS
jgi:hypothetical protein